MTNKKSSLFSRVEQVTRVQKKVNALLTGPANAGKTLSSLLLAKGLTNGGKVLVIDTENGRSTLQVGDPALGDWKWDAAYYKPEAVTSELFVEAINGAASHGYEAIILDSITPEWDYVKNYHQKLGGRFVDWGRAKAPHRAFVNAMLGSDVHILMTMRSKLEYVQDTLSNGKKKVSLLGMAPEGESTFPYEVDFHFALDESHLASMSKTAQGLLTNPELFTITVEHGETLRKFSEEGETTTDRRKRLLISRIRELASKEDEVPSEEELKTLSEEEIIEIGKNLKSKVK